MTHAVQHDEAAAPAGAFLDAEATAALAEQLDRQIDLLTRRESELDALSEAIIANDNDRMEQVLDQMTLSRQLQAQADAELQAHRDALASRLGWSAGSTRLSRLMAAVEPAGRDLLRRRRLDVMTLAERISVKHRRTAVLLAECTRVNRMLIDCMVGGDGRVTLYGQTGRQHWRGAGSLMDTER